MKKLISNEDLTYNSSNTERLPFSEFYNEVETRFRTQHHQEIGRARTAFGDIEDRIDDLEQTLSPYLSATEKSLAETLGLPTLKTGLAHFIAENKYAIVSRDNFSISLLPQDDNEETIKKVKGLEAIISTEMEKARAFDVIKEALRTSRNSLYGATLITWQNPKSWGPQDNVSRSPFALTNIHPKNLRWDPSYTKIEDMSFVYILQEKTWFDIVNDPILGKNKGLLEAIEREVADAKNGVSDAVFSSVSNTMDKVALSSATNKSDQGTNQSLDYSIVVATRFWLKDKGTPKQKCMVSYFIGDDILLNTHEAGCSIIPICMVYEKKQSSEFYGSNTVYHLNSRIKNYENLVRSTYSQILNNSTPIYWVAKDALSSLDKIKKDHAKGVPAFVSVEGQPPQMVFRTDPIEPKPTTLSFIASELQDILSLAGLGQISQGDSGSLLTGSGVSSVMNQVRLLDEATFSYVRDYVFRFYTILLEFITKKYNSLENEAKIRINNPSPETTGPDGANYTFITIPKGHFNKLAVDIVPNLSLNPSYNTSQDLDVILKILALDNQNPDPGSKLLANKPAIVFELLAPYLKNVNTLKAANARAVLETTKKVLKVTATEAIARAQTAPEDTEVGDIVDGVSEDMAPGAQQVLAGKDPATVEQPALPEEDPTGGLGGGFNV